MKIFRYQSGGIYYTPFFGNKSTQEVKTNDTKEENLLKKEIIGVLKENGLPSDVDLFLNSANRLLSGVGQLYET